MSENDLLNMLLYGAIFFLVIVVILGIKKLLENNNEEKPEDENLKPKVTRRNDLVQDDKVTPEMVMSKLEKFEIQIIEGRKNGFTERDIHKQLDVYLKDIFQSVTVDYGIEGKNAKHIDFDIGNGKVGLELKVAEKALKEAEHDRLVGQISKYRKKYCNHNLIIAVAGFEDDLRNTILSDIEETVEAANSHFVFLSAKNRNRISYKSKSKSST